MIKKQKNIATENTEIRESIKRQNSVFSVTPVTSVADHYLILT